MTLSASLVMGTNVAAYVSDPDADVCVTRLPCASTDASRMVATAPATTNPDSESIAFVTVAFIGSETFAERTSTRRYPRESSPMDAQLPPTGAYVPVGPVDEYSTNTLYSPATFA